MFFRAVYLFKPVQSLGLWFRLPKERIDILLVERGLAQTRQKAQALLMAGLVRVNGLVVDKPGRLVDLSASIDALNRERLFVGRGGEKLSAALDHFGIDVSGLVAVDIGSSTGGFVDCLLQRGVSLVYAIDSGKNQLDFRLRQSSKVLSREGTNARYLEPGSLNPAPEIATMDLSFISIRKVLPAVLGVLKPNSQLVVLVKPQFELGPESVSKGGVVREEAKRQEAVRLVSEAAKRLGCQVSDAFPSPITGLKKGNQEYLLHIQGPSFGSR